MAPPLHKSFNCISTGMITNIPNLGMNYINYKTSIVQKYHVQLVGWPSDIPFANPHQLTTIAAAKSLQSALAVSTCKWVVLSKRQKKEHAEALAASAEGGQVVGRKRKVRSDKGRKRGKLSVLEDENDDGEDGSNDDQDEKDRPSTAKKQKSSASRKKPIPTAKKSKVATSSSKNANRITKKLPPAVLKSKEYVDSDDDDSAN